MPREGIHKFQCPLLVPDPQDQSIPRFCHTECTRELYATHLRQKHPKDTVPYKNWVHICQDTYLELTNVYFAQALYCPFDGCGRMFADANAVNRHKGTHTDFLKHELHCTLTQFGPNKTEMENIKAHYTIGQDSEMYVNANANIGWLSSARTNVTGDPQYLYLCPIGDQHFCQHPMTNQALARHFGNCHSGVLGAAANWLHLWVDHRTKKTGTRLMLAKWCPHCTEYHQYSDTTLDLKRHIAMAHSDFVEPMSIKIQGYRVRPLRAVSNSNDEGHA
ncbi:hypothetical protein BGX38DRAFT_1144450 [Terfezia claveryi]|nr:hypothetical protein BGX38DRAFT_1144450 [Terfezia claveryi]